MLVESLYCKVTGLLQCAPPIAVAFGPSPPVWFVSAYQEGRHSLIGVDGPHVWDHIVIFTSNSVAALGSHSAIPQSVGMSQQNGEGSIMNFPERSLIVGCFLAALPATGFSATYICSQADGRKTYTDIKVEAEAKGCKEIEIRPNDGTQRPSSRKGGAVAEPPGGTVAKAPRLWMQSIDWDAPPINLVSGKSSGTVSPDDLYVALSKSVYELTSQAGSFRMTYGSAIAVTSRLALTNCHVVESSGNTLLLIQGDGRKLPAKLVGAQPFMDRCVVESTSADLTPIGGIRSFASLREGERLYAIGNPRGLKRTISDGLLSGKRVEKGVRVVQTTAPISSGSSGGGLFDSAGNLVGITTAFLAQSQNINIAIPAEDYWSKSKVR